MSEIKAPEGFVYFYDMANNLCVAKPQLTPQGEYVLLAYSRHYSMFVGEAVVRRRDFRIEDAALELSPKARHPQDPLYIKPPSKKKRKKKSR